MSELRQNIATKEWTIIATERARRPEEFVEAERQLSESFPAVDAECPFCPGNEQATEKEILRLPANGDWQVRILRNKYPALTEEMQFWRHLEGAHRSISGSGYHDVIIETPVHNMHPFCQTTADLGRIFQGYLLRGKEIKKDKLIKEAIIFKNHGRRAGTSLNHPHSQLIALPVVPYRSRQRAEEARRYFDDAGGCVYCRMLEDELNSGVRIVLSSPHFAAFVLYAAFSPFHIWILPRHHQNDFFAIRAEELEDLCQLLLRLERKLYQGLKDPDYNYAIRTAPFHDPGRDYLHWYITFIPRVSLSAGFEMGSGMYINAALPEESAAWLRSIEVED